MLQTLPIQQRQAAAGTEARMVVTDQPVLKLCGFNEVLRADVAIVGHEDRQMTVMRLHPDPPGQAGPWLPWREAARLRPEILAAARDSSRTGLLRWVAASRGAGAMSPAAG